MSMPELFSIGINIKKDYLFYAVKKKKKLLYLTVKSQEQEANKVAWNGENCKKTKQNNF